LLTEKATIGFDQERLTVENIVERIEKAGYGVAEVEIDFALPQLSDSTDALRLEKSLQQVEGIRRVTVNVTLAKVHIHYIPTIIRRTRYHGELTPWDLR